MIKNNFETTQKILDLFHVGDKKIELSYCSKQISSDGYKKKTAKPAFPKSKSRSQKGKKGHEGKTLRQVKAPDRIKYCSPDACSCGHGFTK